LGSVQSDRTVGALECRCRLAEGWSLVRHSIAESVRRARVDYRKLGCRLARTTVSCRRILLPSGTTRRGKIAETRMRLALRTPWSLSAFLCKSILTSEREVGAPETRLPFRKRYRSLAILGSSEVRPEQRVDCTGNPSNQLASSGGSSSSQTRAVRYRAVAVSLNDRVLSTFYCKSVRRAQ
jgi:hypothetical protein